MALHTCRPRVHAHDNKGMTIYWPGSHACTNGEQGPQSIRKDFTKLIRDLKYALLFISIQNYLKENYLYKKK